MPPVWTPPGGHIYADGTVPAAADFNTYIKDNLVAAGQSSAWTWITSQMGGAPVGSPPGSYLLQALQGSMTTDGSGNGNIVFGAYFPHGLAEIISTIRFNGGWRSWLWSVGLSVSTITCGVNLSFANWPGSPIATTLVSWDAIAVGF